ncbi:MAG TPA: NIPSNAP family protein [Chloroflexota bacterium]|nr:NIPSNAP family protein [Chloroflexota bacterium]
MFYELRKYDVMPGRLPALLDRFGTFTVPHWNERGFRVVGFWTPLLGGNNHQLIYMLGWDSFEERMAKFSAWQASPERAAKWEETERDGPLVRRVNNVLLQPTDFSQIEKGPALDPAKGDHYLFELREYDAMPGKLRALVQRFGGFTIDCFRKHGFHQVGYWTSVMGGHNNRLTYILAWNSLDERQRAFAEFRADSERQRIFKESERDGNLVEFVANVLMQPTAFSPLR